MSLQSEEIKYLSVLKQMSDQSKVSESFQKERPPPPSLPTAPLRLALSGQSASDLLKRFTAHNAKCYVAEMNDRAELRFVRDDSENSDDENAYEQGGDNIALCHEIIREPVKSRHKPSDTDIKNNAIQLDIYDELVRGCGQSCNLGKACLSHVTLTTILDYRIKIFGERDSIAPSSQERAKRIKEIVNSCFRAGTETFEFFVTTNVGNKKQQICEKTFLYMLGLPKSSSQWPDAKKMRVNEERGIDPRHGIGAVGIKKVDLGAKKMHACSYIGYFASISGDCLPQASSIDIRVVPFRSLKTFFDSYEAHSIALGEAYAKETVFGEAWKTFEGRIRLARCKGNFSTCDICNGVDEIIRNDSRCTYYS
jgi:hypothetical protein